MGEHRGGSGSLTGHVSGSWDCGEYSGKGTALFVEAEETARGWTVSITGRQATDRQGGRLGRLAERLEELDAGLSRVVARGTIVRRAIRRLESGIGPRARGRAFDSGDLIRPLLLPTRIEDSLYPYQRRGVAWLLRRKRALLADDMGLGKTAQVLCAVRRLIRRGTVGWGVVVAPGTLMANWVAEARKWAPELCTLPMRPRGDEREDAWGRAVRRAHLLITSYEQLRQPPRSLLGTPPDFLVADEAHRLRRRESGWHRGVRSVRTEWLWALTGTPVERDAEDLAVLMSLLDERRFSWDDRLLHPTALRARAGPYMLRRRKVEVLGELPRVIEREEELELTDAQRDAYRKAVRVYGRTAGAASYLALFGELRALCDMEAGSGSSSKLDRICGILDDVAIAGEKAVVFSYLLRPLYELARRLASTGVGFEVLSGNMTLSERREALERFRKGRKCVALLASSRVGSEGLTLTEANHVIFLNRWWNPSANSQARDRVVRIGQRRVVFVWGFTCRGTVETALKGILSDKRRSFEELVEALDSSENVDQGWLFAMP